MRKIRKSMGSGNLSKAVKLFVFALRLLYKGIGIFFLLFSFLLCDFVRVDKLNGMGGEITKSGT